MEIKKSTIYFGLILILIAGASFFVLGNKDGTITGNVIAQGQGEVQKITLSVKDYNYYPNEIRVKAGQPIQLSLDNSVTGCLRSFTIRDLGVQKYLQTPNEVLEFTVPNPGTYRFACVMGMGTGTLIAE